MSPATSSRLRPDRFLGISTQSPPKIDAGEEELTENDVFWTGEFSESESNHTSQHSRPKGFMLLSAKSGILAVLPEPERSPARSVFNHKASSPMVSSSSSTSSSVSSARIMIPVVPKKPSAPNRRNSPMAHHSVPVSVPMLSESMRRLRDSREFDNIDDVKKEGEGCGSEILPPHKLVKAKETPALANSMLEGFGRTLKGRDLRQVRNAIWRKTGYIDYEYGKRGWE